MAMTHRVVFDGTRDREWGPYLADRYEAPRAPEPIARRSTEDIHLSRQALIDALRDGPRTFRELVAALQQSASQVNRVLYDLQRWGVVARVGTRQDPASARGFARGQVNLYGLAEEEST